MEWQKNEVAQYFGAKDYIDTLLIPLIPVTLSTREKSEKLAGQAEFQRVFVREMEKQFKGRIFLFPAYNYLDAADKQEERKRLNSWVASLREQPFHHVFFFTHDHHWKKQEQELDGNLIWLPAMLTGEMNSEEMHSLIKDQVSQISDLVRSYW